MRVLRAIVELSAVVLGSVAAGCAIGTVQAFVVFGVWDAGFGWQQFHLSFRQGGLTGAIFAIPTGLIIYYGILKRAVTLPKAAEILAFSLIAGCTAGLAYYWMSCFFTPLVTMGFAHWLTSRQRKLQRPAPATI